MKSTAQGLKYTLEIGPWPDFSEGHWLTTSNFSRILFSRFAASCLYATQSKFDCGIGIDSLISP